MSHTVNPTTDHIRRSCGWGTELWDKYDNVLREVSGGCKELETWYGGYLKERSKVEAEYAKALRKIVKNFTVKEKNRGDDESTQARGFRKLLEEVGYQAGQHEVLADVYGKESCQAIEKHVKGVRSQTKKIKKEAEDIEERMKMSYKQLEKRKINYVEAHADLEATKTATEHDEKNISRLELDKKISVTNKKTRLLDDAKAQYAHQLIKTNNAQKDYYDNQLPSVLHNLQDVYIDNVNMFKTVFGGCIKQEQSVSPIISKCHMEMVDILDKVDGDTDTNIVINRLKTGNVPPSDFQFEELLPGVNAVTRSGYLEKRNSLVRIKSKQSLVKERTANNVNYFQMRRELEKNVEMVENELSKGQKEMKSLQLMVHTYRNNPKFGDVTKFEMELESVTLRVQHSQSQMYSLQTKLKEINGILESIKNKSGEGVNIHASSEYLLQQPSDVNCDNNNKKQHSGTKSRENTSDFEDDEDYFDSSVSFKSDDIDDISEDTSDKRAELWVQKPPRAVALYPFQSDNSETIQMSEGEEFFILEDDIDGWTKVRRKSNHLSHLKEIGYVPSSFIKHLL